MPLARPRDSGGKRSAKRDPHIGLWKRRELDQMGVRWVRCVKDGCQMDKSVVSIPPADCLPCCNEHPAEDEVPIGGGQTHAKECH